MLAGLHTLHSEHANTARVRLLGQIGRPRGPDRFGVRHDRPGSRPEALGARRAGRATGSPAGAAFGGRCRDPACSVERRDPRNRRCMCAFDDVTRRVSGEHRARGPGGPAGFAGRTAVRASGRGGLGCACSGLRARRIPAADDGDRRAVAECGSPNGGRGARDRVRGDAGDPGGIGRGAASVCI